MKTYLALFLISCSLLFACKSTKKTSGNYRSMDTFSVSAFNNPINLYRASAPRAWNIVHTRVALSFDYKNKTANGEEWVILQPYFYATDSIVLDAKAMKIEAVTIGHEDKPLKYTYDSSQLHIALDRKYTKDEPIKLYIKYVAMPYSMPSGGSSAITDDKGLYFINTDNKVAGKPIQIWTQGETESNSHWLPTIDKPNSRTTLQIELTVPSKYKTLSNGELISTMDKGYERVDIWKMDKPIQVYAIMFAIGDFAIAKDKWKNKEVNYYVEQNYAAYARKMFQHTPEMIHFFSEVTGVEYPWNKYSQVVVRDYVSGAMENTSASLFGEFMNQNSREYDDENHEDVVSHELFHQWFGDYVTAESWSNLTVNESFATYGEYLWRNHKYGKNYADELKYDDLQKYLNYAPFSDPELVRFHYRDKEDMFDRVSYQKGGAILHYLHHLIGDSAFYKSMQIYLTKNALQSAEATQWRLAVEEATGKDMHSFFDQWYGKAGHPILDIKYTKDDEGKKLKVVVTQVQKDDVGLYELPLDILVINGNVKRIEQWHLTKKAETFFYDYKEGIAPVIVPDIAHLLPGVIKENKTTKDWLSQINSCDDYISQLFALQSVTVKDLQSNNDAKAIVSKALDNKIAALRLVALEKLKNIENENERATWKKKIIEKATLDGNNKARAMAFQIIGDWKISEQKSLLEKAIGDSSYLVAGNALYALWQIDTSLGYVNAKQYLNQKANTNLDKKAWAIITEKGSEVDSNLFIKAMKLKDDANKRNHLDENLLRFAIRAQNISTFSSMLRLFTQTIKTEENNDKRQSQAEMLSSLNYGFQQKLKKEKRNNLLAQKSIEIKSIAQSLNETETEAEIKEIYESIFKK